MLWNVSAKTHTCPKDNEKLLPHTIKWSLVHIPVNELLL